MSRRSQAWSAAAPLTLAKTSPTLAATPRLPGDGAMSPRPAYGKPCHAFTLAWMFCSRAFKFAYPQILSTPTRRRIATPNSCCCFACSVTVACGKPDTYPARVSLLCARCRRAARLMVWWGGKPSL
ncbi:hypothetical protein F4802DRAFT_573292 [Xylaria palmicola]|nr:hypothetical protein F4802DRAFT_573292 [Xylaria palmicola]